MLESRGMRNDDCTVEWAQVARPTREQRRTMHKLGLSDRRISLLNSQTAIEVIDVLIRTDQRNLPVNH